MHMCVCMCATIHFHNLQCRCCVPHALMKLCKIKQIERFFISIQKEKKLQQGIPEWRNFSFIFRSLNFSQVKLFSSFFILPVKFLREVTPYFRKASIISEVGWELQRAFLCPLGPGAPTSPPAPKITPRADTRYIPLQLTHLARNLKYIDPGE